ncbi:hypothetical protein [Rhodosalinus sp.]|uniref:hypothetical protein n=1 Tax=Rhodosalinus sp. TaxID=2047741 RepID=UPI003562B83C
MMGGGYGMGGGGLIWLVVIGALVVIPFWKLLPRFGIPAWVSLVAIIPLGALVLLWIMAFKDDGGRA